jgi:undecaprenyl-diphosphatase
MASVPRSARPAGFGRSPIVVPRPGRRAIGLALGIGFLLLLIDAVVNPRAFFDLWAMRAVQRLDGPGLHPFFEAIERLTSSEGAVAAWVLALVVVLALRWWAPVVALGLMPVGGLINLGIGAFLVERSRPHVAELARTSANWEERSFPSGHVMGAVMFYGLLFVVARKIVFRPLRLTVQIGSVVVIGTVGIERLWEGAHWPTDVLGAYALGGLLLVGMLALYARLDRAVAGLPLIHAAPVAHDEARPHAHALTSLVRFDGDRVAKTYAPGFLPRALYWLAFQAPFAYIRNEAALRAAMHRRNLAAALTEYWYGAARVARVTAIERRGGQYAVVSERIEGRTPADRYVARTFLRGLATRFEEAGLPTWQIDPRQPRAIDNLLETDQGTFTVVDLESGLVSPLASLRTWKRALRRGMVPFYDDVFFDVTREYLAREEQRMRAAKSDEWFEALLATVDAAEDETRDWHRSEPRYWHRLFSGVLSRFGVRTLPARLRTTTAGGREKAQAWLDRAVEAWERDGRLTPDEAAALRAQMAEPAFQATLPYFGAHILLSIPLRFPLGSIVRPLLVLGALAAATGRFVTGRTDRAAWMRARAIHSPLVVLIAATPGIGSLAYLAAKPIRANRLLLRATADAALQRAPWRMYERSGLRRFIARPSDGGRKVVVLSAADGADAGPIWELAWAVPPRRRRSPAPAPVPQRLRSIPTPADESCRPQAA